MGHGNRLFAQALHVERELFLALRHQHAGVKDARLHHRPQAAAQALGVQGWRPGAYGLAVITQHAHQTVGQVGGFGSGGVGGRPAYCASRRDAKKGKVGLAARPPSRLGHMQLERCVRCHPRSPRAIVSRHGFRVKQHVRVVKCCPSCAVAQPKILIAQAPVDQSSLWA
jgi:hypothetical protein